MAQCTELSSDPEGPLVQARRHVRLRAAIVRVNTFES